MVALLERAQKDFGFANQITVATEELCELAAVLSKYPRYPNHELASDAIRTKVVEEVADVMICLIHISGIFKLEEDEVEDAMEAKLVRLERWLDSGKGFHQTTVDREVAPVEPQGV
jgi:NTP pyrophosphatase (non-canonical NTP hydrolase)